ncbi:MAG: hypothetical protein ACPL07_02095, partial [Candidatus Bathyarchaeia archaeon]
KVGEDVERLWNLLTDVIRYSSSLLVSHVVSCFSFLKPLSSKPVLLPVKLGDGAAKFYMIGSWIQGCPPFSCARYARVSDREFLDLVRWKGEFLAEHVRKNVREAFLKLVNLSRRLELLEDRVLEENFSGKIDFNNVLRLNVCVPSRSRHLRLDHVDAAAVRLVDPAKVFLASDGKVHLILFNEYADAGDFVKLFPEAAKVYVKLLSKAAGELKPAYENNKRVLDIMREAVAPFEIAEKVF